METYVPSPSNATGILGKTADGEVDSIQAWKKDMKARELRAKGLPADSTSTSQGSNDDPVHQPPPPPPPPATVPLGALDEIQQFKLMMKKEEEKRAAANSSATAQDPPPASKVPIQTLDGNDVLNQGRNVSNATAGTLLSLNMVNQPLMIVCSSFFGEFGKCLIGTRGQPSPNHRSEGHVRFTFGSSNIQHHLAIDFAELIVISDDVSGTLSYRARRDPPPTYEDFSARPECFTIFPWRED